ncbi:MAG: alcohol dehydrogenase catalytic domain-containing protein [Defluviitaleaceae bacterium]|nr:alcohol dehydrogenase catalytic domain-containing protein [Defluviitaleaceae bacterium]
MKAALVTEQEVVSINDIDKPILKNDEVLIRVVAAGVCGSDLHLFHGTHAFRKPPAILGHEIAGDIVEVGSDVKNLRVGDRVTVEPHAGCGECEFCKQSLVNICLNKTAPGTPKWIGTFVEYFNAPEKSVHKIADGISYEMGVMVEPLAVAVHAMDRATVKEKDCIVILGAGSIGLLTQVVAREMGYKTIICTDTAPFNRKMALKLGAAAALDPITEDVAAKVKELTNGRGADLVIVSAGAPGILDQASDCARKRGEIGVVSMITEKIPFYSYAIVFKEQTMYGSMTYETKDFVKAVEMINNGLDLDDLVTQKYDLSRTQEALAVLSEKKEDVVKVLVTIS